MTNIEVAHGINKAVQNGDANEAGSLVTENYVQHTPVVADGRKGLVELVNKIKNKQIPAPKIKNIRTFTDGDFVILHHDVNWPTRKSMFEIFRFEGDLAAEHWSGIMDHPEKTANGNTMTDGETAIVDKEKTETNKKLARSFVEEVLIGGAFDKVNDYYHPDIKQHNPYIDNGIAGLVSGITALSEQGISIEIKNVWKVFGEGNFVMVCSEGEFGGKHTAFFDLFRIEGGKVAEHWDVLQEIPPPSSQAHENGFFQTTLYKRIGGYDAIAGFVDTAFPKVAAHPKLERYFIGHATESKYRQRQLIVDKISSTLQGPTFYIGRALNEVHKGLNITAEDWDVFMGILVEAMNERGISGETKSDFIRVFQHGFRMVTVESEMK